MSLVSRIELQEAKPWTDDQVSEFQQLIDSLEVKWMVFSDGVEVDADENEIAPPCLGSFCGKRP